MSFPVCPHSHSHLALSLLLILAPPWDVKCCWARGRNWGRGSLASSASQFPPYRKYSLSKTRRKLQMFSCVFLWSPVMLAGYSCVRIQRPLRNHFPMRVTIRLRRPSPWFCAISQYWLIISQDANLISLSMLPHTSRAVKFLFHPFGAVDWREGSKFQEIHPSTPPPGEP